MNKVISENNQTIKPTLPPGEEHGWRHELDQAVKRVDEPAIWALMDQRHQDPYASDILASIVSRMAYTHAGRAVFNEIFMMPVIMPPDCLLIGDRAAWSSVRKTLAESLQNWFSAQTTVTLFEGILPLDWVSMWQPRALRDHLMRLVPGSEVRQSAFTAGEIELPPNAPRLGFILVAGSSRTGWPKRTDDDSPMSIRLCEVSRHLLQMAAPSGSSFPAAPTVIAPNHVNAAITDGLAMWLDHLDKTVGIKGWAMLPSVNTRDAVKFTLHLDSEKVPLTQFIVRLHQIGMMGLEEVMTVLASIANNMETPNDQIAG